MRATGPKSRAGTTEQIGQYFRRHIVVSGFRFVFQHVFSFDAAIESYGRGEGEKKR